MSRQGRWLLGAALTVAACQSTTLSGELGAHRPVVIEALLVGNTPLQTFTIRWASSNADPAPMDGPAPGDVHLWVVSPAGDSVPVVPIRPDGTYSVALTPVAGGTYRLVGTISDSVISGRTTLPALLRFDTPHDGDTATLVIDTLHLNGAPVIQYSEAFSVQVAGAGAKTYLVTRIESVEGAVDSYTDFPTDFPPGGDVSFDATVSLYTYRVAALDSNVWRFTNSETTQSGLHGAVGFFGSQLLDSVRIYPRKP